MDDLTYPELAQRLRDSESRNAKLERKNANLRTRLAEWEARAIEYAGIIDRRGEQ